MTLKYKELSRFLLRTTSLRLRHKRIEQLKFEAPYVPGEKLLSDIAGMEENLSGDFDHGNYREAVKSLNMAYDQPEEAVTREAVHMQMREQFAEYGNSVEEMSMGDTVSSALGLMIPKRKRISTETGAASSARNSSSLG